MFGDSALPRVILVFGIVVPLAVLLGYLLATPQSPAAFGMVGLVLMVAAFPVLIRWHHLALVCLVHASLNVFFLPGQPSLWIVLAFFSLGMSILNRALNRSEEWLNIPMITWSLILLLMVVLGTAFLTGGFGGRVLGSEQWGARRYLGVIGAIVAYFAFTARPLPPESARLATGLFFLSGVTAVFSNLIFYLGPAFYFLYSFFPYELSGNLLDPSMDLQRLGGIRTASTWILFFMTMRYGLSGIFDPGKFWRLLIFVGVFFIGLFGGFRSYVVSIALLFFFQFWYEGLIKLRNILIITGFLLLGGAFMVGFSDRLPLTVQRSLTFLPLKFDRTVQKDAKGTMDWRLEMWAVVFPKVPNYLLMGKGFSFDGMDYYLTRQAVRSNQVKSYEDTLISGNYHHGFLTLVIPFGIWGVLTFLGFSAGAFKALYNNYKYGSEEYQNINTFLFALFTSKWLFYLFLYGQFDLDLIFMTSVVGLNVSLNGGMWTREKREEIEELRESGEIEKEQDLLVRSW
ncbi:MAG: hypothetical protein K9N48_03895 [Verrucomicrobia bacterium]|nr:hypothetical protein [Verrucomicrobiota bacterium]MCF7708701.1 hypothetical protein [Verrucomicrobiota bacterium]